MLAVVGRSPQRTADFALVLGAIRPPWSSRIHVG
jgi:hypothetical protein